MDLELIHGLYAYHRWANRRLFDAAAALGEDAAGREVGKQFSFPTLKGMLAHIYGADFVWLARWKGVTPAALPGDADFPDLTTLRARWDALEGEQRAFIESLAPPDLHRIVAFKSVAYPTKDGEPYRIPLGPLVLHVANHATHHRSELATMLTMASGSPPGTDLSLYHFMKSGQMG